MLCKCNTYTLLNKHILPLLTVLLYKLMVLRGCFLKLNTDWFILTTSTEHHPSWEANSHSPTKQTLTFMEPKVPCHVHESLPLHSILSQMNPIHTLMPHFLNTHSNIILPSTHRSSNKSLPFKFSDHNFVSISDSSSAYCMSHPSHPLSHLTLSRSICKFTSSL